MADSVDSLLRAIVIMDSGRRWTNNIRTSPPNCYCVYTAMLEAHFQTFQLVADFEAYPAGLDRVLRAGGMEYRSQLLAWNDRPGRTWKDVKSLLKRAAEQPSLAPEPPLEERSDGA